jgi:hypothetical protein
MLMDVTIPGDRNVIKKKAEKILKFNLYPANVENMVSS